VTELDGQTLNRDGVDITVVETGDHIMTRADGSFAFPNLEPGWYTLQFDRRVLAAEAQEEGQEEEQESEETNSEEENKEEETASEEEKNEEESGEETKEEESDEKGEEGDDGQESEEDEDELGRPRCKIDGEGPVVIVKVVLDNGELVRWSKSHPNRRFVRVRLEGCNESNATGLSAGNDYRGQIRVAWREGGEHQMMQFRACGLDAGDGAVLYLRDSTEEGSEWQLVDDGRANSDGCVSWKYYNREGGLPLEARNVDELAGYDVEIRDVEGNCLLKGEVPALPERIEKDGEPEIELPEAKPPIHGKDHLIAKIDGVFGAVAIGHWGAKDLDRFEMFAGGLEEGEQVKFQIRDPETEEWVTFATPTALERDHEELGYAAFVDTEWHGVLPLHADSTEDLEGLGVRVVRTTAEGDQVILIGEIPDLVR
jgi:hypothetical protein